MKKILPGLSLLFVVLMITACPEPGSESTVGAVINDVVESGFADVSDVGEFGTITMCSETFNMIYANNRTNIIFPFSPERLAPVNNYPVILTRKFFMGETQVTNALMVEVLQWAYDNGKFSASDLEDNGVKYGGQRLLFYTDTSFYKIHYSLGSFTVENGYENHPVVYVTWYGAIMFCNWLTEMRDGNTTNVVYTGIDDSMDYTEIVENADRNGYRLPSTREWEYSARYIGTTEPAYSYVDQSHNGGSATLTAGFYWTRADYASGAIGAYTDETATRAVAWYEGDILMGGNNKLMPVAQKKANQLGLYDMSGNVNEWCFTLTESNSVVRGGCWFSTYAEYLQVGYWYDTHLYSTSNSIGFRIARTL